MESFNFLEKIPSTYHHLKSIQNIFLQCYFDSNDTQKSLEELIENEKQTTNNNFHLDFGVIYSWNNNFRLGLHLTSPFVAFYWKF